MTFRLGTGKPRTFFYSVELLLLSLLLLASLLHVAGFSTVADFPTDPAGHAAVDNHLSLLLLSSLMLVVSLL